MQLCWRHNQYKMQILDEHSFSETKTHWFRTPEQISGPIYNLIAILVAQSYSLIVSCVRRRCKPKKSNSSRSEIGIGFPIDPFISWHSRNLSCFFFLQVLIYTESWDYPTSALRHLNLIPYREKQKVNVLPVLNPVLQLSFPWAGFHWSALTVIKRRLGEIMKRRPAPRGFQKLSRDCEFAEHKLTLYHFVLDTV